MALFHRKRTGGSQASTLDEVIDLTTDLTPLERAAGRLGDEGGTVWGMPGVCPRCGDYGYLDHIDLINEVMLQHCPTCWHRWEVEKTATVTP